MSQRSFIERNDVVLCVIKVGMSQATGNNCGVVKLDPQFSNKQRGKQSTAATAEAIFFSAG